MSCEKVDFKFAVKSDSCLCILQSLDIPLARLWFFPWKKKNNLMLLATQIQTFTSEA
jgi:hypothetical protein